MPRDWLPEYPKSTLEKRGSTKKSRPAKWDPTRWLLNQSYTLKMVGLDRDPFIRDMLNAVVSSDDPEFRKSITEGIKNEIAEAVLNADPFAPHPDKATLEVPGILLGTHSPTGFHCWWGDDEQQYSMLILGAVGGGKTNFVLWVLEKLTKC